MRRPSSFAPVAFALAAPAAQACTLCHSPTARLVRDHVLRHAPGSTMLAVMLPLGLLAILIAVAGRERNARRRR